MSDQLLSDLAALSNDPYRFVLWAFPWGEEGSELAAATGPEAWQVELLSAVRDGLLTATEAIQIARASGHGIGKSAMVSWLILWSLSTFPDTKGVVTANTENQLKTKTWAELAKWHRLFIAKELFRFEATSISSVEPGHERTWRIDMVPWSERNTEAFAGLHNKGRRILVVFDEASAIPDVIWETTEGALTDSETQIFWFVFGNPTRNSGRFRECFAGGKFAHRWRSAKIDSRTVSITNKDQFNKWIDDYGEDSDFVRIRVKGEFPRVGTMEFISLESVQAAIAREDLPLQVFDPIVLGVDVARFGDDASVIFTRKGRDGRSFPPVVLRGVDTMTLAGRVADAYTQLDADAVFVDGGGVGGGVVDRLRQLGVPVIDVQFGSKSDRLGLDDARYANKRSEIWGSMREWIKGGTLPAHDELREELVAPTYGFNARDEIQLEKKEDMKRRGVASPDIADALALTFAYPVVPTEKKSMGLPSRQAFAKIEYNPLEAA